jgi:hypothetical protein
VNHGRIVWRFKSDQPGPFHVGYVCGYDGQLLLIGPWVGADKDRCLRVREREIEVEVRP